VVVKIEDSEDEDKVKLLLGSEKTGEENNTPVVEGHFICVEEKFDDEGF
jgi:hypothetical protein